MTKTTDASRILRAWLQAWNMRCCPPDAVLAGRGGPELEEHLRICPLCRRTREDVLPPVDLGLQAEDLAGQKEPGTGELWSLAGRLAGWGPKRRYYSPPVVLVTGVEHDPAVSVVQTFGDTVLAGPGDILLDNRITGFAEPWNRYTVRRGDLELFLGSVTDDCLRRVIVQRDRPFARPEEGSLLWFFRQMEVETGWYFARQAVAGLLGREEAGESGPPGLEMRLEDLRGLPLILPDRIPDDLWTLLARTLPADDLLSPAAAGGETSDVQILEFIVSGGRIRDVRAIPATVTLQVEEENILRVSGHCDPEQAVPGQWIFRWQSDLWSVAPLAGQHGMEEGVFWAAFPLDGLEDPTRGQLVVRVLVER